MNSENYNLSMAGKIRTKEKCPKCGKAFITGINGLSCPECQTAPKKYFIDIYWKQRFKIYSDLHGHALDSYARAHRLIESIRNEIDNHTFDPKRYIRVEAEKYSFSVYASNWLAKCEGYVAKQKLSPSYMKELRRFVNKRFIPFFLEQDIRDLRTANITAFYDNLPNNLSLKTQSNIMSVLHKLFSDALLNEDIRQMPSFPEIDVPDPDWSWCAEDVQDDILVKIPQAHLPYLIFMARQGVRPAEARALKWDCVDLSRGVVTIRRNFSLNKLRDITKAKNIRIIPLDPLVAEMLKEMNAKGIEPDSFVFTKKGRGYSESYARKLWNSACKNVGVENLTLYQGTRHSLASQAVNRNVSLDLIGAFLGHKNPKMTKKYAHANNTGLRAVLRSSVSPDCPQENL